MVLNIGYRLMKLFLFSCQFNVPCAVVVCLCECVWFCSQASSDFLSCIGDIIFTAEYFNQLGLVVINVTFH